MALSAGIRLGPYEIGAPLGAGGMGEVYRARDTRLNRTVAIKVLAAHLVGAPAARERFDREARAISGVSHPNICTLYDVGHQDGVDYLVMEYLEGETLARRLQRGALPIELTLRHAIEIADALDKAHQQGVVHRDLKPGNVILTKDGSKLLDFGLAKLHSVGFGLGEGSTRFAQGTLTASGALIGTIPYMSPEQVEGKDTDPRTDIFAFGAILYEMATGRRAFQAASQASLVGAILHVDPPALAATQPLSPPLLEHVVRKCLAKHPSDRWQTARDLADALRWIGQDRTRSASLAAPSPPLRVRSPVWFLVGGAMGLALVALGVAYSRLPAPPAPAPIRFEINSPQDTVLSPAPADVSVSPDGRHIVFGALNSDGNQQLWLRPLNVMTARPLAGTENAFSPFWSPDGQQIGFFASGKLKRIVLSGGEPQTICDAPDGRGGTWNGDGVIVFARSLQGTLYKVPSVGGTPTALGALDSSEAGHVWPEFLPDGDHYLYLAWNPQKTDRRIRLGSLKSGESKTILSSESNASFASPGYLLFVSGGRLLAQGFDGARLETSGDAFPVAEDVWTNPATGRASFAGSSGGVLAYRNGVNFSTTQFVVRDRTGRELNRFGTPGGYGNPSLSPDGRRMAVDLRDFQKGTRNIWTLELKPGGIASRFTLTPTNDFSPIWMPTGRHVLFLSDRAAPDDSFNIYRTEFGETGKEEVLFKPENVRDLLDWCPSETAVVFQTFDPKTKSDLWILKLSGDLKAVPLLPTAFNEIHASLSPDCQWIAYSSDESGRFEIYVKRFPSGGSKQQVSGSGGMQPQWNQTGNELFYLASDRTIMAARMNARAVLEVDVPRPLFQSGVYGPSVVRSRNNYVVSPDGQTFIINTIVDSRKPINVITGWAGR